MPRMTPSSPQEPDRQAAAPAAIPDRLCTWCKVPMTKRLVGGGQYIHYTCPKCVFQHATKREKK
jgi:hypothetical protein